MLCGRGRPCVSGSTSTNDAAQTAIVPNTKPGIHGTIRIWNISKYLDENETRMLQWMCEVAKKDTTRNERVRGSVGLNVAPVIKRIKERANVVRACLDEGHTLRWMLDAPVPGKRRRGRHKTRWKDSRKRYMESEWLKYEDAIDRTRWKNYIQYSSDDPRWWGHPEEKEKMMDVFLFQPDMNRTNDSSIAIVFNNTAI